MGLFNYFLIDLVQERLLCNKVAKQRTALQYLECMLDLFTCTDLIMTMFHFLTGLPMKTQEEELLESDELDSSSYHSSRLSMSIEGNSLLIDHGINKQSTEATNRKSDLSLRGGIAEKGILSHF